MGPGEQRGTAGVGAGGVGAASHLQEAHRGQRPGHRGGHQDLPAVAPSLPRSGQLHYQPPTRVLQGLVRTGSR